MKIKPEYEAVTGLDPEKTYFTLEQANATLPYVSRVVADVCEAYRSAMDCHRRLDDPGLKHKEAVVVQIRYDRAMSDLSRFSDELNRVGCELKDYDLGLIDFPHVHEDREVNLCWKLGEDEILAWHEVDAGFSNRRPVAVLEAAEDAD